MTVNELLSVAITDAVEIIIRENGERQWIYGYRIGEDVQIGRFEFFRNTKGELRESGRFFVPDNRIEICRCDGRCKMLVIPKAIKYLPKEAQNLEVSSFRYSFVLTKSHSHGMEIWCYPSDWTTPAPQPMQTKDEQRISLF